MYVKGLSKEEFVRDQKAMDAVIRNLEVIGEAAKNIPDEELKDYPGVPWHELRGMRNILIHEYFGVDEDIIWEVVTQDIGLVAEALQKDNKKLEKRRDNS